METMPAGRGPSWPPSGSSPLYQDPSGPQLKLCFQGSCLYFTFSSEKEGLPCSEAPPLLRRPVWGSCLPSLRKIQSRCERMVFKEPESKVANRSRTAQSAISWNHTGRSTSRVTRQRGPHTPRQERGVHTQSWRKVDLDQL